VSSDKLNSLYLQLKIQERLDLLNLLDSVLDRRKDDKRSYSGK
jgi:hypothetical protein